MTLPRHPNLTWTLAFWLAAVMLLAIAAGVAVALLVSPAWLPAVAAAAAAAAAAGPLLPHFAERAYRRWNALAEGYAAFARAVVLHACYFVLITGTSRAGSRFAPGPAGDLGSSWVPKSSPGIETHRRPSDTDGVSSRVAPWIVRYVSWSRRSGNAWAVCLLPFVLLLTAFDVHEEEEPPARLYTLY